MLPTSMRRRLTLPEMAERDLGVLEVDVGLFELGPGLADRRGGFQAIPLRLV